MKDKSLEKLYDDYAKFYLSFLCKTGITFDSKEMEGLFHYVMFGTEDYDKEQVNRIINKGM